MIADYDLFHAIHTAAVEGVYHQVWDRDETLLVEAGLDEGDGPTVRVGDYHFNPKQAHELLAKLPEAIAVAESYREVPTEATVIRLDQRPVVG